MSAKSADPGDDFAKWLSSALDDLNAQAISFGVSRVERRRMAVEVRAMLVAAEFEAASGDAVEVALFHTGPGKVRVVVTALGADVPLCEYGQSFMKGFQ